MKKEQMKMKKEQMKKNATLTRRVFLKGSAIGAGAVAAGTLLVADPLRKVVKAQEALPPIPWDYAPLDVELVRQRGYEEYFRGGCMHGGASALILTLQEEVGYPWTALPYKMYSYGSGGAAGWGTLCGSLNGVLAVMNLLNCHGALGNELIGWYTQYPFPSAILEGYEPDGLPKALSNVITTVSNSPLCHISVSTWCNAAGGVSPSSAEKKDRCAKLTGDTAARAAELMNAYFAGTFAATFVPTEEYAHCLSCHATAYAPPQQGKMNCVECHTDGTYHVGKELIINDVWTTDTEANPKTEFSPGDDIRYHVRFSMLGPGAGYVKTSRAKAVGPLGTWKTLLKNSSDYTAGTHEWVWSETIPNDSIPGRAKVVMPLSLYDYKGGILLSEAKKVVKFKIV